MVLATTMRHAQLCQQHLSSGPDSQRFCKAIWAKSAARSAIDRPSLPRCLAQGEDHSPRHGAVEGPITTKRTAILAAAAACSTALLKTSGVARAESNKRRNLPIEEVKQIIARDFQQGQYYITGALSSDIFTDDALFIDPTTRVQGVQKYSKAVASLFDQASSRADLISIKVEDPHTIVARWRFDAALRIPGKPRLKAYTGTTTYLTNDEGLIALHTEQWDISALDAFVSILFPNFGAKAAPPVTPLST